MNIQDIEYQITFNTCSIKFPKQISTNFKRARRNYNCLAFSLLKIALESTMFQLKGISKFNLGTIISNQYSEEEPELAGYFFHTTRVKRNYKDNIPINELIKVFDKEFRGHLEYGNKAHFDINRDDEISANQEVDMILAFQKSTIEKLDCYSEQKKGGINKNAKFPLSIFVIEEDLGHHLRIEFDSNNISHEEVNLFASKYLDCIGLISKEENGKKSFIQFKENQNCSLISRDFPLVCASFSDLILKLYSGENKEVILGSSPILRLDFLDQAGFFASVFEGLNLDIIPIWTNRSGLDLAMMLGVWMANKKFLAIDRNWPRQRLITVINDLGDNRVFSVHKENTYSEILDFQYINPNKSEKTHLSLNKKTYDNSGYIIYTSGTSGTPKGVIIDEKAILNFFTGIFNLIKDLNINRIALNALFSFDAFIQQYIQLFSGKSVLVLNEKERSDFDELISVLNQYQIELIDVTPSLLSQLFEQNVLKKLNYIKVILVGGERIDNRLLTLIKAEKQIQFYNMYGPCECTVDMTFSEITPLTLEGEIGIPFVTSIVKIQNEMGLIVPKGVSGEIIIEGDSVSQGYLNRDGLTSNHFSTRFSSENTLIRSYKTGDLGYVNEKDILFIHGRKDQQIKRNGVRIELEEISNVAIKLDSVVNAICHFDSEEQYLTLFIATKRNDLENIRAELDNYLPKFYMPNKIKIRDFFPLNLSGKINLNLMIDEFRKSQTLIKEPNPFDDFISQKLSEIWSTNLNVISIFNDSDFFDLGGDSLRAFKVINDIQKEFSIKLGIIEIFSNRQFKQLVELIRERQISLTKN